MFFDENQIFSLVAMATWSFHTLIMGRIEKWHLLPSHCRYFNKTFIEVFLEKSSIWLMYWSYIPLINF